MNFPAINRARFLFSVFLTLLYAAVLGQSPGSITGKVFNASGKTIIESASVTLSEQQSGKPIHGTLTDAKGNFTLSNVAPGNYIVKIGFVGFTPTTRNCVMTGTQLVDLGPITLTPATASLKEVTVTAARPLVETHLDKIVYNAANDLTSQSGVALDVLKKVPSVSVDVDGNVAIEGNPSIRFLINGKPSTIFGASLADALQSIPAAQIKSVEVIASPGAKYDAAGTGGIINIILKDNRVKGVNGSMNLSAGTRLENGALNLNMRQNNFGVNAFFSGNEQLNTTTLNTIDRLSFNTAKDTLTRLHQQGSSAFRRRGFQTGISAEWDLTPKDKLTASFSLNHFDNLASGLTAQQQTTTDGSGNTLSSVPSTRNAGSTNRGNSSDWSLDYHKTFKQKGRELDMLVTTSGGKNFSDYYQQQDYPGGGLATSGSRGNTPGKDRQTDLSFDYTQPLGAGITLETGAKAVLRQFSSTLSTDTLLADLSYKPDAGQTNAFTYKRQIYAYYVSAEFALFKHFFDGRIGLRYEYTNTSADFQTHIPSYSLFFPSIVLSHKLDETQSVKVSYSHRIERPEYGELNPFYNISDPHNVSTGNPYLRPEKGQRYELGYSKSFGNGTNLYAAALYRYNTDDIQSVAAYYPVLDINGVAYSDVSLSQRYNIGSQRSIGANIFGSASVTPSFSIRSNMMFGRQTNQSPGLGSVSGFAFRGNLNASYKVGHDWTAEAFGTYNSSQKNIQGIRPAFAFYTLAARKEFWNRKASLGLTATNPFNKYINQKSTLYGTDFTQSGLRQVPYQSFGITLSYKFGKLEFKGKERTGNNEPAPIE